jgi:hypothetical protein
MIGCPGSEGPLPGVSGAGWAFRPDYPTFYPKLCHIIRQSRIFARFFLINPHTINNFLTKLTQEV